MIKKDIIETEVRTSGFKKVQDEILASSKKIDEYKDSIKNLEYQKRQLVGAGKQETKEYQNVTAEITKLRKEMTAEVATRKNVMNSLGLTEMSYNQLKKRASELAKEMKGVSEAAEPEKYAKLRSELERVEAQVKKVGVGIKNTTRKVAEAPGLMANAFGKVKDFLPAIGIGNAISSGASEIRNFFRDSIDDYKKYDEALTDAMKTTNQSKEGITAISENLKKIDTRTAQNDLLGLARVAGKLGIDTASEIEGFVRSADKINVALTEDLGGNTEEAINQIGKLIDIFHIEDQYGMEDGMIRIGSAINEIGAASTANEGYLVEFSKRVAGVAPNANISIQNVLGLAGTLDKLGQRAETSATVYGQVITKMHLDTKKFAQLAGMDVKAFTDLLDKDANAAFIQLLKGLQGNSGAMSEIVNNLDDVSVRGAAGIQVLGALIKNVESIEQQQKLANTAFADGTSVMNEFNKKNQSAEAQSAKIKKEFTEQSVILGEKLAPVYNSASTGVLYFVKAMVALIGYLIDSKGAIIAVTATWIAYNAYQKLAAFYSSANAVGVLREIAAIKAKNLIMKEGVLVQGTYTLGQKAMIAVKALLIGQFKAAGIAAKGFFASLGPAGWAVSVISVIVGTMALLSSKTKEAKGSFAELALKTKQESDTHLDLRRRLAATSEATAERAELIKLVNKRYGEYLPSLLTEKSSTEDIATALDLATVAMKNNIAQKIRQQELEKIQTTQYNIQKKILDELLERYSRDNDKTPTQMQNMANQLTPLIQGISETSDKASTLKDILNKVYGVSGETDIRMRQGWGTVDLIFDKLVRSSAQFQKNLWSINSLVPGVEGNTPTGKLDADGKKCAKCGNDPCTCKKPDGGSKKTWSLANDENFGRAQIALKKRLMNGEIATEAEHNRLLLALEIKTLEDRLKLTSVKGEERVKLERELLDKQYTQNKAEQARIQKLQDIIDGGKDPAEQERIRYEKQLKELGLFGVARENMTKQDLEALLTVEKAHTTKLSALHFEALNKQFDASQKAMNKEMTTLKTEQAAESANLKTFKDKEAFLKSVYTEKEMQQITTDKKADQAIKAVFQQEEAKAQEEHLRQMLITYQSMMTEFAAWGTVSGEILTAEDVAKFEAIIAELEAKLANLGGNIELTPETGADGGVDILGMTADKWESMFKNLADGKVSIEEIGAAIGAIGGAMGAAFSDVSNLMSAIEQRDLKQFEKNQNKKKQALDRQLKAGTISQEAYNARVQQMDEETEVKRQEVERKQAERQKMLAVFQALISTAVAVTGALGSQPYGPWNIALAAVVGALGAVQVAAILAQPLPGAEEGGMLVERMQDGKRFNAEFKPQKRGRVDKPTVIVGENGAEYVVPSEGYDNPSVRSVLDIIEASRLNGTLRHIDLGSVVAASNIAGRAAGGYVSTPITAPQGPAPTQSSDTELHDTLDRVGDAVDRLVGKLDNIRAYVSHKELRDRDKQYNNIRKTL